MIRCWKIISMAALVCILFLLPRPGNLFGQAGPAARFLNMRQAIETEHNDSTRIERLCDLAFFCNDFLDDHAIADSLSEVALSIAHTRHRPELVVLACNRYAESTGLHENYRRALACALEAEQAADASGNPEAAYLSSKNLAIVYLSVYQYDKALEYIYKSLSLASSSENAVHKAESYLAIGRCLEGKNQKIEAFRNYITASNIAEKEHNPALLKDCYDRLSSFYNFNKLYNKATRYKLMQRNLVLKGHPADSAALMWIEYDLQVIDINSNNNHPDERSMLNVLHYAARTGNQRLMNYEIALYRTHLVEADKIGLLKDLYLKQFPVEWAKLALGHPSMFYRLKAYFCEEEHRPDSALFYFGKADELLASDPNLILRSKFYNRYAAFLLRHGDKEKAVVKYTSSYQAAERASYFEYMVIASRELASLYASTGDYKNAFRYSVLNKALSDSINNLSKQDQILVMEIDHETRQRERQAEQEKQETLRRHYLQYTAITIGILSVFVLLIMLGSLKVPEWIIRMLGFFSFIFLFEFIILLADHKIHELTAGEPWKVLLIKIFLIAILLPLHHEIEKIVVSYLLNHKLLNLTHLSLVRRFREKVGKRGMKKTRAS